MEPHGRGQQVPSLPLSTYHSEVGDTGLHFLSYPGSQQAPGILWALLYYELRLQACTEFQTHYMGAGFCTLILEMTQPGLIITEPSPHIYFSVWDPGHGMVQSAFRVGLPSLAKPFWKPHK